MSDFDLPQTPAGAWLAWWIGMLNRGGEGAQASDWERYSPALKERVRAPLTAEALARPTGRPTSARMGEITGVTLEADEPLAVVAVVSTAKDRRWVLKVDVEPEPPHAASRFEIERRHDFQLGFREATAADAAILADIERRCPIVMGETSVHFDRGDDYMAATRLMEDCSIGLASVDGVPAAVSCGAEHVVRVGGALKKMVTVSHLRVLPEHQRKGLWGAANKVLTSTGTMSTAPTPTSRWTTSACSTASRIRRTSGRRWCTGSRWIAQPWPVRRRDAGDPRRRGRDRRAAERFHDAEELFVPYTAESFTGRMDRAPDLYDWDRVWLTEAPWSAPGRSAMRCARSPKSGGVRTVSRSGVVLDYAFEPGAEDELEALLRAWCGQSRGRGLRHPGDLHSPASPGAVLLERLGRDTERFFMWTPGIEVPEGAQNRGLYVDAIYF